MAASFISFYCAQAKYFPRACFEEPRPYQSAMSLFGKLHVYFGRF